MNKESLSKIQLFVQAPKIMHQVLIKTLQKFDLNFEIKEFYHNVQEILLITDLAITRGGAGTINDIIIYSVPSLIIPLPNSINNHQFFNAKFVSDKLAGIILDQNNFNVVINSNILIELIDNKNKRNKMIAELKKIHIPNANEIILSRIA